MGKSYGFIEIPSTTAAIDALDHMVKAADVEFVTWENFFEGSNFKGKLQPKHVKGGIVLKDIDFTIKRT